MPSEHLYTSPPASGSPKTIQHRGLEPRAGAMIDGDRRQRKSWEAPMLTPTPMLLSLLLLDRMGCEADALLCTPSSNNKNRVDMRRIGLSRVFAVRIRVIDLLDLLSLYA